MPHVKLRRALPRRCALGDDLIRKRAVEELTRSPLSTTVHLIVTLLVYQPFVPAVPVERVRDGRCSSREPQELANRSSPSACERSSWRRAATRTTAPPSATSRRAPPASSRRPRSSSSAATSAATGSRARSCGTAATVFAATGRLTGVVFATGFCFATDFGVAAGFGTGWVRVTGAARRTTGAAGVTGALRTGAGCVRATGGASGETAPGGGSGAGVAACAGTARTTHSSASPPAEVPRRRSNDHLPRRAISPRSPGLFSKLLRIFGCVNEAHRPAGRFGAGLRGDAFCLLRP